MRQLRHPAMIVAAIALFIALGGGMAIAAGGLISGSKIKNYSIPAKKLTRSAVAALTGAGSSKAYSAFNGGPVNIGGGLTTVATLKLGAGTYVVTANGTAMNSSNADDVGCYLDAPDSTQMDYTYTSFSTAGGVGQSAFSLLAPLKTTGGNVIVRCIGNDASSTAAYTRIVAITVGSVTGNASHFHAASTASATR